MPQSLARVVTHLVFSTKNRVPFLKRREDREGLHAFVAGSLQKIDCEPIVIGGTEDHLHALFNFSRTITIAKMVEDTKTASSRWIKEVNPDLEDFYWQGGYGIFSVSESNVEKVRNYVVTQEEHHRRISFQDEFRALCRKHRIPIDERYVWD